MSSIISIDIANSTETSPLKFFEKFYTEESIKLAYANYLQQMPDLNNPDDQWVRFPVEIDTENKTWTIEFTVETSYDEYSAPSYQTYIKEFSFKNELEKLLRDNFFISRNTIAKKIDESTSTKSQKDTIRNFIKKCLLILDVIESGKWIIDSNIFSRPIRSLIRFCYVNFNDIAPSQKIDGRIGDILKEKESSKNLYESTGLLPSLADNIQNIKDSIGNPLINYVDETDLDKLKLFLNKNFSTIKGNPIRLIGAVGVVNYFLSRIILLSGLKLKDAAKYKMFSINHESFFANYASTDKYRIGLRNELVMLQIDEAIMAHSF
jgi:hypothetical protein